MVCCHDDVPMRGQHLCEEDVAIPHAAAAVAEDDEGPARGRGVGVAEAGVAHGDVVPCLVELGDLDAFAVPAQALRERSKGSEHSLVRRHLAGELTASDSAPSMLPGATPRSRNSLNLLGGRPRAYSAAGNQISVLSERTPAVDSGSARL